MFIYTVRSSSIKFFAVLVLTLAVMVALIISSGTVFASAEVGEVNFGGMKTEDDRIAFLGSFGLKVKEGSEQSAEFVMPEDFDRVLLGYNQLQKSQGLDLSKYAKKKVTRYTYTLTDYNGYEGEVEANLLVYRNRIIACDVSSADPEGFVEPIIK